MTKYMIKNSLSTGKNVQNLRIQISDGTYFRRFLCRLSTDFVEQSDSESEINTA